MVIRHNFLPCCLGQHSQFIESCQLGLIAFNLA